MEKHNNWVYLDKDHTAGVLLVYMTDTAVDAVQFLDTVRTVLESPKLECCTPFTHLFTRYDKATDLNAPTNEAN